MGERSYSQAPSSAETCLNYTRYLTLKLLLEQTPRSMHEDEKDYSISFALPTDTNGIVYTYGRQSCDTRKLDSPGMDTGNVLYSGQECTVVFDNVFVPWERVFMYKEWDFSNDLVENFASYHRHNYACKSGIGDVLIGAC